MKVTGQDIPFAHLRHVDLFADLSDEELRQLLEGARLLRPQSEEVLFEAGSQEDSIFFILSGTVIIFRNRKVLKQLVAGEYFGEVALIEEAPRSASARSGKDTVLLELPSRACRELLESNECFRRGTTRMLCTRLRQSTAQVIRQSEKVHSLVHDMRHVLWMLNYAQIVEEDLSEGDPNRPLLQRVKKAQLRLQTMAQQILDSTQGRSQEYMKTAEDLEDLVRACLEIDLAEHPEVKRVQLSFQPRGPMAPLRFHVLDMTRVIANLVVNAAEASPEGALVTLGLWQEGDSILLTVEDQGCGIALEDQDRIYERHFSTKRAAYGLGLTSCQEIVEGLHGGRLSFHSTPGLGTTFRCEFPIRSPSPA